MRWYLLALAGLFVVTDAVAQTAVIPPTVNYAPSTSGSVSSSATIVSAPGNKSTTIVNTTGSGGATLWIEPSGQTAAVGRGLPAVAGDGAVVLGSGLVNPISAICTTGTCTYTVILGN